MRKTFSLSLKPQRTTSKFFLYFQKNTDLTHDIFTANKPHRKPLSGGVVKDCSMTVLSTDAAQESHNKITKIAKTRDIKAVNQTSSDDLSRLSQKSVDNLVQDPVYCRCLSLNNDKTDVIHWRDKQKNTL